MTLVDVYPKYFRGGWRPTILLAVICVLLYLIGIVICTQVCNEVMDYIINQNKVLIKEYSKEYDITPCLLNIIIDNMLTG